MLPKETFRTNSYCPKGRSPIAAKKRSESRPRVVLPSRPLEWFIFASELAIQTPRYRALHLNHGAMEPIGAGNGFSTAGRGSLTETNPY